MPPAHDALCSVAKRAPRKPEALGAARALARPAPLPGWERGKRSGPALEHPAPPRKETAYGNPPSHAFIHSFTTETRRAG